MKVTIATSITLLLTLVIFSSLVSWKTANINETLKGAWQQKSNDIKTVKILSDRYFMFASYNLKTKAFVAAGGGTWEIYEDKYKENIEYFTTDSTKVGSSVLYTQKLTGRNWMVAASESNPQLWEKIEEGETTPLTGVWRIRERVTPEGKVVTIQRGPRKTVKILSGTRFQWAAFNTETKEFFGTGGGTYEAKNGKYIETIEFFSRDASRVGLTLTFDFETTSTHWHHLGLSTTGNKIDEIWAREEE